MVIDAHYAMTLNMLLEDEENDDLVYGVAIYNIHRQQIIPVKSGSLEIKKVGS